MPLLSADVFEWLNPRMVAVPTPALRSVQCRWGWRFFVWTALSALGWYDQLQVIYQEFSEHNRIKQTQTKGTDSLKTIGIIWRILQESCTPIECGVWALPA